MAIADLSSLLVTDEVAACIQDIKAQYRRGLPALAPTEEERPLRATEMVNPDLDLGFMQHPVVLTLMASRDPFVSTALAASSRLMWNASEKPLIAGMAGMIGQLSQHDDVRTTADVAAKYRYDPEFVQEIGHIAIRRVPEEQDRAMNILQDLLATVRKQREAPRDFMVQLMSLGYACNLSRDTFERLFMSMVRSPDIGPKVKDSLVENLHIFPRHLLIAVAMEVSRLPPHPSSDHLKQALELALINARARPGHGAISGAVRFMSKLGGWFGSKTATLVEATSLIENLRSPDPAVRRAVADSPAVTPEMLFLLAGDPDPSVRRAVASHRQTPAQVSPVLAADQDVDVREVLLRRLLTLLPDLSPNQQGEVYQATVKALETLARDEVLRIREALANTLKDVAYAPYSVVKTLAEDLEETVSRPVLQLCTTLTDDDLLEIISRHPADWVLPAIARRDPLSAAVTRIIIEHSHEEAGGLLLDNRGAVIDEDGLEAMVEQALGVPAWHPKLAGHAKLPNRLARRMAEFVEEAVLKMLAGRKDFDAATKAEVASVTRRRLDYLQTAKGKETPEQRALQLHKEGRLDEIALQDAISWNDRVFVMAALGVKLNVPPALIERIFATRSPRAVVAISWKAGFNMRTALQLQRLATVAGREILNARNGEDYPLSPKDMLWQLELVGVVK